MNGDSSLCVCNLNANLYPVIDASLCISLAKGIHVNIMKIIHLNSKNKSGNTVLIKVKSNYIVPKKPSEVDILYFTVV